MINFSFLYLVYGIIGKDKGTESLIEEIVDESESIELQS